MTALMEALRTVEFLRGEPDETLAAWIRAGRTAMRARAEVLWRARTAASGLIVPVTGEAKTIATTPDGREFVDRLAGPGECLGLQSALDGLPHETTAVVTHAGDFFDITRPALHWFLDAHAGVRRRVLEAAGRAYRETVRDREDVVLRSAASRVARFLVGHACARTGDGSRVLVQASQSDIGGRLGTVREVVARVLSDFESRGYLTRTDTGWFVDDWRGLRAEARLAPDEPAGTGLDEARVRAVRFLLVRGAGDASASKDRPACEDHLGDLSECVKLSCPIATNAIARGEAGDRSPADALDPAGAPPDAAAADGETGPAAAHS